MKMKCIDENKKEDIDGSRAPSIIEVSSPRDGEGILNVGLNASKRDTAQLIEMIRIDNEATPLHSQSENSRDNNQSRLIVFDPEKSSPYSVTPANET